MNVLSLLRNKQQRIMRLHEAQLLSLKAYRGVEYRQASIEMHRTKPVSLTYRGSVYTA